MYFNTNTEIYEMQYKNTLPKNNFVGCVSVSLQHHCQQSLGSGLYLRV